MLSAAEVQQEDGDGGDGAGGSKSNGVLLRTTFGEAKAHFGPFVWTKKNPREVGQ